MFIYGKKMRHLRQNISNSLAVKEIKRKIQSNR